MGEILRVLEQPKAPRGAASSSAWRHVGVGPSTMYALALSVFMSALG